MSAGLRVALVGHATLLIQVAGLQHPDRSRLRRAGEPGLLRRPASGSTRPGIAFDDLPPIDAVLVTHNHYDHLDVARSPGSGAATGRASSRRSATTRSSARSDPDDRGRDARLGRGGRSRQRRHGPSRAGLSLVGARHQRPPHGAVVRLCADDAGRARSTMSATRLRRRPIFRAVREPLRPAAARDPADRRLRAALVHAAAAHEPGGGGAGLARTSAPTQALGHHWGTFRLTNEGVDEPPRRSPAALGGGGSRRSGSGPCDRVRSGRRQRPSAPCGNVDPVFRPQRCALQDVEHLAAPTALIPSAERRC